MEILIDNHVKFDFQPHEENITKVINTVLELEDFTNNVEISLVFVDNDEIQKINKRFRNIDKATDVLSFPQLDDFDNIDDSDTVILGDIIISVDKASEQAMEYQHSIFREVAFLVAHSMLHLLGYDHMTGEEEEIMINKQKIIMDKVNISR